MAQDIGNVLVTGGAGYIGSHVVLALTEAGYDVTVIDNLSTGSRDSVLYPAQLVQGDLADKSFLRDVVSRGNFSSVFHFAANIIVPQSFVDPINHYHNNVVNTLNLLEVIARHHIPRLVFSSSASVYGNPVSTPVNEDHSPNPISPYGRSKLMGEWLVQDLAVAEPWFRYGILRYFNVAGCDPFRRIGHNQRSSRHLIKLACSAALGLTDCFYIYGNDYATKDGTGVRDFIHVSDLATAHLSVLRNLESGSASCLYNCGYGQGYSVLDILNAVKTISKTDFEVEVSQRRQGDPAEVVADVSKILSETTWKPQYNDIRLMVKNFLDWEKLTLDYL